MPSPFRFSRLGRGPRSIALYGGAVAVAATLAVVAAAQQTPPVVAPPAPTPPAPPVIETPDYDRAVWEPASPGNFQPSARPSLTLPIDRIVIHDIEGSAISAVRWFQNPQAKVTSHYVVDAQAGRVYQMVKERDIAWHAGDRTTNARSVGIEHEGFAYRPGFFTATEYEASARLTRSIALRHNIPRDRTHIIGHFEVPDTANPGKFGGRSGHTDPGPYWDWDYFMALVRSDAQIAMPSSAPLSVVLHPGETKEAMFPFANTGDDPWLSDTGARPAPDLRAQGPVYLGACSPSGKPAESPSAFYGPGWISPRFVVSPTGGDVAPGREGRFTVPLRAPSDFLGQTTETFRLVKVPVAPRLPVPFGPVVAVTVRVEPWDLTVPLPAQPPVGWSAKTYPNGARAFWRKAAVVAPPAKRAAPPAPDTAGRVRWETNLPVAGAWDVYVRYPAGTGRNVRAVYEIPTANAGEPTPPSNERKPSQSHVLDQRTGGGQWRKLGRFRFTAAPANPGAATAGVRPGAVVPGPPPIVGAVELLPATTTAGVIAGGEARFVGPFPASTPQEKKDEG